ncbi:AlwI family type II restriction endonuclease [Listeria seeligeri]|uniref:AlwI family type II restriction endonuclease n=1 Tax=Listeria seeligeri TaxID=1640 RepID=UPI0016272AA1|nr:AlwI family type II restriction endonuclease [Listeria seeligeri]MBC1885770.1 AlwI family type II restriction endonuclease [Listeria seeligeri]
MALNKLRSTWFVTRPQRDPQFFPQALESLKKATNNFNEKWTANRDLHKKYEKVLAENGLKKENISADGSGGRTWVAMLRTYSLVYISLTGKIVPTKVGLALLNGEKKHLNLTKQLLTLQIPNAYFVSSGFKPKYDEGFSIRPIRFLIRLCCQSSLDYYITKEEIIFFAMTSKNDRELDSVIEKIKDFRLSNSIQKKFLKQNIATIDYRERSDKGARDFEAVNGDVAHTLMLQAGYTGLVNYSAGKLITEQNPNTFKKVMQILSDYDERYPFDSRYKISEPSFSEHAGLDIDSYKSRPIVDAKVASNQQKVNLQLKEILSKSPNLIGQGYDAILKILFTDFPPKKAEELAHKIAEFSSKHANINEDFMASYLNQTDNLEFEKQTVEVLRALGFETVHQPKPVVKGVKTSIEILIHLDAKNVAIIDTKNYKEKFTLTSNLSNYMATEYIPTYQGYNGKTVTNFGYITASKIGGVNNLKKVIHTARTYNDTLQVKGLLISATALLGLLDYCIENDIDNTQSKQYFITLLNDNKAYQTYSEVSQRLNLF